MGQGKQNCAKPVSLDRICNERLVSCLHKGDCVCRIAIKRQAYHPLGPIDIDIGPGSACRYLIIRRRGAFDLAEGSEVDNAADMPRRKSGQILAVEII